MSDTTKEVSDEQEYSISDLSAEFDVTTRTLRWYETEGLLTPLRRGTRRIYRPRDRTRLRLILRGKRVGFSLAEIREIVDMYDAAPGEQGQLELLLDRVGGRRIELERRRADIERMLTELDVVEARAQSRLDELTTTVGSG